MTPPRVYEPAELAAPGPHKFGFTVKTIAQGGLWQTSAAVFVYGP